MSLATGTSGRTSLTLQERVVERLNQGLAPPAEAYHVHNRSKIDWTQVPEWAQPGDPDLFEGCGHEG